MRISRSAGAIALALAAAATGVVAPNLTAHADDANAECTNNSDITVVVDFQDLGGGVNVRCAPQPVRDGFEAFTRANISVNENPASFVCQIAGLPETSPCTVGKFPPSSYYWVYWIADRGGEWCYSQNGGKARTPPPGSIEGWSFFKKTSERPRSTPPRYPVPGPIAGTTPNPLSGGDCDRPAPTPTTAAPSGSSPTTEAPVNEVPNGGTSSSTTARGARAATTSTVVGAIAASTSTPSLVLDLAPTTSSSAVPFGDVDLSVGPSGGGGNLTGFVVSVGAIAGVGAVGFALRRRNRLRQ